MTLTQRFFRGARGGEHLTMTATPQERSEEIIPSWLPSLMFAVAALIFTGPALVNGGVMAATDILLSEDPYDSYLPEERPPRNGLQVDQVEQLPFVLEFFESARGGELQLWEPDVGGGVPLFPAVYNRLLVPWNLVQLLVPGGKGVTIGLAFALFGCQLATYGLARRIGLGRLPAALAAVAYAFSGPVTALLLRIHEVLLAPFLFYALHGAVIARRPRWIVLTAAATAFVLLAGFPAAAVMTLYAAAAWLAWLALSTTAGERRLRCTVKAAWPAAAAVGAGGALAAVQLLPSLSFLTASGSLERSYPIWHRAEVVKLATAVSGRFFGAYQDHYWWWPERGYSNPVEASMTVGLVALALLGLIACKGAAVSSRARQPISRFFLPLGLVVFVGVFLGGPLLGLLHQLPFVASNSFGRSRFLLSLAIALASGLGLERLLAAREGQAHGYDPWLRVQVAVLLGAVALGVYEGLTIAARESASLRYMLFALGLPLMALTAALVIARYRRARPMAVGLGLVVVLASELQFGSWGFTPPSPQGSIYPDVPAFEAIEPAVGPGGQYRFLSSKFETMRPNAAAYNDLKDVRVAWPAYEPYRDLLLAADPDVFEFRLKSYFTEALDPASPVLDRLSARYLTQAHELPLWEIGDPLAVRVRSGELPITVRGASDADSVRGLSIDLRASDPSCQEGWVELSNAAVTSRRLLREVGEEAVFPLPDVAPKGEWTVRTTHCPVAVTDPFAAWLPVAADAELQVMSIDGWTVYERPRALPRATLAGNVETAGPDALDRIRQGLPSGTVLADNTLAPGPRAAGTARIVRDDPDVVDVRVDILSGTRRSGLLVLRDVAAPGWTATVDGRMAEIHRVDHAFRGVEVVAGDSVVRFSYAPPMLRYGSWLALSGFVATAVVAFAVRGNRPPRSPAATR